MRTTTRVQITVLVIIATIAGVLLSAVIDGRQAVDDAFVIDRFDREVWIQADGTTLVVETIDVTFLESRRGIFRDLPPEVRFPAGGYDDVQVDSGPRTVAWPHTVSTLPDGTTRIRVGVETLWLDPGPYRYRLSYRAPTWSHVRAADPDVVETRLDIPGFDWPTTIGPTTLTVHTPGPILATACVAGRLGTLDPCPSAPTVVGQDLEVTLGPFDVRESATVSFHNRADDFDVVLPAFDEVPLGTGDAPLSIDASRMVVAVLLLIVLLIPILVWIALRGLFVYRDRVTDPALHNREHPTALPAPPFGMRPAEVAGLLRKLRQEDLFLGTLVDLDQRREITTRLDEDREGAPFEILPAPPGAVVEPVDAAVIQALLPGNSPTRFEGVYDPEVSRRVKAANTDLSERAKGVYRNRGFEHNGGRLLRNGFVRVLAALIWVLFALAVADTLTTASRLSFGAGFVIVIIVAVGTVLASAPWGHHRLPLNSAGRDAAKQAQAFEEFLRTVEGEQIQWAAGQPGINHHHPALSLLPYAIALGMASSWYSRFGDVMRSVAQAAAGTAAGASGWYLHQSSLSSVQNTRSMSTVDPSSSSGGGGGGGGGGSGGGGGGGGSW